LSSSLTNQRKRKRKRKANPFALKISQSSIVSFFQGRHHGPGCFSVHFPKSWGFCSISLVASESVPHVQHAPAAFKVANPQVFTPLGHICPRGVLQAFLHIAGDFEAVTVHHTLQQIRAKTRTRRRHLEEEEEEIEVIERKGRRRKRETEKPKSCLKWKEELKDKKKKENKRQKN